MLTLRRLGRFFGPWLAYAALNGLGGSLACGFLASVIGLISAIFMLLGGASGSELGKTIREIAQSFPNFALVVLICTALGFAGAFLTGTIAALVGGAAGLIWSLCSTAGVLFFAASFYPSHHGFGAEITALIPLLAVSSFGAIFSADLLERDAPKYPWDAPIRRWMRASWIMNPPQAARLAGIILPLAFCLLLDAKYTLPVFLSNRNYVARMGNWATWLNSRRFARVNYSSRRSYCQSNLKQIMLAVKQYQQDYDEFYPPKPVTPANGVAAIIQPYVRSTQLFQCPQDFYMNQKADFASGDFTDYWFNARFYGVNDANVSNTSNSITWGEGNTGAGEANAAYSLSNLPANFPPLLRHLGGSNYAFADGHVKWLKSGVVSNALPPGGFGYTMTP